MLEEWGLDTAESGCFLAAAEADDPLAAALAVAEASAAAGQNAALSANHTGTLRTKGATTPSCSVSRVKWRRRGR